jgi:hypothetical protein
VSALGIAAIWIASLMIIGLALWTSVPEEELHEHVSDPKPVPDDARTEGRSWAAREFGALCGLKKGLR